jgi:hypothetical protein
MKFLGCPVWMSKPKTDSSRKSVLGTCVSFYRLFASSIIPRLIACARRQIVDIYHYCQDLEKI